jgi:predicted metal-binding protein
MEYNDDTPLFSSDAIMMIVAFIICVECAKEPEYRCENCDKSYKQEARYKAHIAACVVGDKREVSPSDFSELLRQNREMMDIMRKQQETIQLLVARLLPCSGGVEMNIE